MHKSMLKTDRKAAFPVSQLTVSREDGVKDTDVSLKETRVMGDLLFADN
jgi:hypothetical protein